MRRRRTKDTDSVESFSTAYFLRVYDSLKNQTLQPTTRYTYHKVWTKFNEFVIKLDFIPEAWEEKVTLYCTYLTHCKQLQSNTIRSYVSAIKTTLVNDGYAWNDKLLILSTFVRACKLKHDRVLTRFPIQIGLLELLVLQMETRFETQAYLEALYKTAFVMGYYGLFRIGELTSSPHVLKAKDVHKERRAEKIKCVLHTSKTHGRGDRPQQIVIATDTYVKRRLQFNPVQITLNFLELRPPYIQDDEQFLVFSDNTPVRAEHVRNVLRNLLEKLNLEADLYDTHSFRIGRATDLLKFGAPIEQIKRLGRWKSNAVFDYLRHF